MVLKSQGNLFTDLPPPGEKPLAFKPASNPIWTENKAKLIERYLYYFVLITKHGAYIDGFAAPQQQGKPESWAAKLVLESKPRRLRELWLCDISRKGVRRLEALVADQPKIRGRHIHVVLGDFNQKVKEILQRSNIAEKTATFCLLDQRTFECEWQTLQILSRYKHEFKIELFYFLATGWLDRALKATSRKVDRIERWWGRADWRSLQGMNSRVRAELFCSRFRGELGYKYAYAWEIYSREMGGTIMYHMIHATDHDQAPLLMNRAYRHATNDREAVKRLQHDLAELWGSEPADV
jgi:three-Cys-motif partner protein